MKFRGIFHFSSFTLSNFNITAPIKTVSFKHSLFTDAAQPHTLFMANTSYLSLQKGVVTFVTSGP